MSNTRTVLLLLAVCALAACDRVNKDNYAKLETGQSFDEVKAILGKPAECNDMLGTKYCEWGNDQHTIKVTFVGDEVIFYAGKGLK